MAKKKVTKKPATRNRKAKGSATKAQVKKKEPNDIKRSLNMGQEVELSFGNFTVKELDIYTLISILSEGFIGYMELAEGKEPIQMLTQISSNDKMKEQISKIFATFCGTDEVEPFMTMSPLDFARLFKTINEVVDFEEIKEAFLESGLQEYLTEATSTSP